MARYISRAAAFKKTVLRPVNTIVQGVNGPEVKRLREPTIAMFRQSGLTDEERLAASAMWPHWGGVAEGEDPLRRCSYYDTDQEAERLGWNEETKAEVEALLDRDQSSDYFRFDAPRLTPPWPTYDQTPASRIPGMVRDLGLDPEAVAAYELQNEARREVLKGMVQTPEPEPAA